MTGTAAAGFDPLAEGFTESPYKQYSQLRDHDPVHRSELLQGWVVTRFNDVGKLLRDTTVSSDIHRATPNPLTIMEIELLSEQPRASRTIVLMDESYSASTDRTISCGASPPGRHPSAIPSSRPAR